MATSIISFPFSGKAASTYQMNPVGDAVRQPHPTVDTALLPLATLRHRGLHVVGAAASSATASLSIRGAAQSTSQAQANRIVAQVEQEIARQALREAQQRTHGRAIASSAPAPIFSLPSAEIETPASVARRIFAALLSFARPA